MSEGRASVGSLALVLHSHMPYVEGFGTYPFGEEWLFDAVIRSYAPLTEVAERVTFTVTPVLADQLEAEGVNERLLEFCRRFRIDSAEADAADVDEPLRAACLAEAERYNAALERLERLDGDLLALFAEPAAARSGRVARRPGDSRGPADARHPPGAPASARRWAALAPAPVRGAARPVAGGVRV